MGHSPSSRHPKSSPWTADGLEAYAPTIGDVGTSVPFAEIDHLAGVRVHRLTGAAGLLVSLDLLPHGLTAGETIGRPQGLTVVVLRH